MDVNPEPFDMKALVTYCCATVSPLLEEKPDVKLEQDVADGMKLMKRRRLKLRGIWSGSGQKQGRVVDRHYFLDFEKEAVSAFVVNAEQQILMMGQRLRIQGGGTTILIFIRFR